MSWPALWAVIFWGLSFIATKCRMDTRIEEIFFGRGGNKKEEIKILTSKLFSDIKCRCNDRFRKGGQ